MGLIPFLGSSSDKRKSKDGNQMKKDSSNDLPGRNRRGHRGTTPDGLNNKMNAKDISFIDDEVHFSVQGTSNSMNVARSKLLKQFDRDATKVSKGVKKVMKALPDGEAKEVKSDIVKTENSNQEVLIKSDISGKEKALVAAEILEEVSEQFAELTDDLFQIKSETTDTNYREKKSEFKKVLKEASEVASSSIELYYLIEENANPERSNVEALAIDAANLYKNSIKAFSAVCKDSGHEVGMLEEKVGGMESPEAGRGGKTIFENYFNEPIR